MVGIQHHMLNGSQKPVGFCMNSWQWLKALKALYDQKDLQVPLNHGKHTSVQDELDKYDFTIRVLMSMLRKLRASAQLKANVFRSLCKKDQTVLEILLAFWPKFNSLRSLSWMSMFVEKRMV